MLSASLILGLHRKHFVSLMPTLPQSLVQAAKASEMKMNVVALIIKQLHLN